MREEDFILAKYNKNAPVKCRGCKYRRPVSRGKKGYEASLTICHYLLDTGKARDSYNRDICTKWEAQNSEKKGS